MAETIKIAELSIKTDKLLNEMQATKSSIEEVVKSQKKLKDAGDTTSQTFIQQESKLKVLKTEYNAQTKTLQQVTGAISNLDSELKKEVKSLADAAANNKALRQQRENLNTTTDEGKAALDKINAKLNENTKFMKSNQDEQIQSKMNVGNYKDSILEATGAQQAYTQGSKAMAATQMVTNVVVGKSTGALKLFRIALAATGVGLLVLALGSLIAYFTQTQEGINKVNMVLTPLKELFGELKGAVQEFGAAIAKLFSGGTFKAFFKDMGDAGEKVKKSFDEAWKRGKEIETLKQNLSKTEADYITLQAKLSKEFEEQNKLADDQTKSAEERAEAAQRAIEAQAEISKGSIKRIEQEAEILRLKQMANDTSDEERAELATKLAEIDKALQQEASKTKEAQNKLNAINKKATDDRLNQSKKAAEDAKARREQSINETATHLAQELELFKEQSRLKQMDDEQQLNHLEALSAKELEILDFQLNNKLISETQYQTEKLKLDNQLLEKQGEIAQIELDNLSKFNEKKKALTDEIYFNNLENDQAREEEALIRQEEKEIAELERLQINEERKAELLLLLNDKYNKLHNENQKKWDEEAINAKQARDEEELAAAKAIAMAKMDIALGLSDLLSGLVKSDTALAKALLLFEKGIAAKKIIMNTSEAVTKAIAKSPTTLGMPWSGLIAAKGAIELGHVAALGVQGFMPPKREKTEKPKFALGGNIFGASHAGGGVQLEAEGGESIINKRSTSKYGGLLSLINQAEGGNSIMGGNQSPSGLINYDLLAAKMAQANMSLPSPVVGVDEIQRVQGRTVQIEERARF